MTCGIYVLRFEGTDKVYVGQSISIEARFTTHVHNMISMNTTGKLHEAFTKFGTPIMEVLCECSREELDLYETEAISIFNCITNGFNTREVACTWSGLVGEDVWNSKYSNTKYLEVFNMIIDSPDVSLKTIASLALVDVSLVYDISSGECHSRFKELYPEKYDILISLKGTRNAISKSAKALGIIYPRITSKEGVEYTVDNVTQFALQHGLNKSELHALLHGRARTHKGWRLSIEIDSLDRKRPNVAYPPVVSPEGVVHTVYNAKQFAIENNAGGHFGSMLRGTRKSSNGWKLAP